MPEMSALEHLKIAKRYHFQGLTNEAIWEYEAVLKLDPDNADAIGGLRALGVEPTLTEGVDDGAVGHAGGLKTNFFTNQSKPSTTGGVQTQIFNAIILGIGVAAAYGLYILVTYLLNYDNIEARNNVDVQFEKAAVKDGVATVSVSVVNLNPAPIKHMKISYRIADPTDATLKEGQIELPGQVPAGDRRNFVNTSLGELKGVPAKLSPKLESLIYGPKPKIKERYVDEFMKAAALRDKDALAEYEQLVTDTEDFAPSYVGLGRAYAAKGDMDEALKQYKKAEEIDPMNANAHFYSAVALYYKGNREEAKKEIDQAVLIAPDDPEIAWNQKYLFSMKDAKKPDASTEEKPETTETKADPGKKKKKK